MTQAMAKAMTGDAIRGYVIRVRDYRKISQERLAARIGMPERTYIAWESGETKDIKAPLLLKLFQVLEAPFEHLGRLVDKRYEDGARLAELWINTPLAAAVEEAEAAGDTEALERFSRYLQLVASGSSPKDAAREVLGE